MRNRLSRLFLPKPLAALAPEQRYGLAGLITGLTIIAALFLHQQKVLDLTTIAMLFLLIVALTAVKLGRSPAILTAVCGVASFNFFCATPSSECTLTHTQSVVIFIVMLAITFIITHLTNGLQQQAANAQLSEQQARTLYDLEKLNQETQLHIASERLRNSMLSALSHDLRTPLTALYGMAESLQSTHTDLPPAVLDTLQAMRDQTLHLNSMVSNLLEMARLQSGIPLRKEWQPLEEVIGSSIKLLKTALKYHRVKVSLPPNLPLLEFDALLMERVLCNLLENAIKYSPPHTVIQITAALMPKQVAINICNAGEGFPTDKLNQLFELFERGNPESTTPGMGLGLSICRTIVEAHHGTIHVANQIDGGCVSFYLPLGTPPAIESEPFELKGDTV